MDIKTKHNIGDRVWIVNEHIINNEYVHDMPAGEVSVYDDYICSIEINKEGTFYLLKYSDCMDLKDDEIILYHEIDKLLAKIQKMMSEINEREKKENDDN